MTWLALAALAIAVFVALLALRGRPRDGWEALAAALMVGLAGYALQGQPTVPSAPKAQVTKAPENADSMVAERQNMSGADPTQNKWLVIGDALARQGNYADAATVLRGAVEANPKDSEAWLALANALSGHAQGSLSPAALYAYRQAAAADPKAPGPPFFLGLAMARAGRFDETRSLWAQLLAHAPADAKWRNDLAFRIEKLDKLMEMIRAQQAGGAAPGAPR
jgi:cytochrome c-type biogenesis protein CcmH